MARGPERDLVVVLRARGVVALAAGVDAEAAGGIAKVDQEATRSAARDAAAIAAGVDGERCAGDGHAAAVERRFAGDRRDAQAVDLTPGPARSVGAEALLERGHCL